MSLNKFMHPRNIYQSPLDYEEICKSFPAFESYTERKNNGKATFNYKNRDGLRCLTMILLQRDFGLNVTIPENKLIPTLPLRLNYILWLEDLLNAKLNHDSHVHGIDIGTGATCIYSLLAAKKNGWEMLATDIDEESVETATSNTLKNNLQQLITVIKVPADLMLHGVIDENKIYDFCMCNPPFFDQQLCHEERSSDEEMTNATGTKEEISAPGGEVQFVKRIIDDSVFLRDRIKIYTTMLGHKSSVASLTEELEKRGIRSYSRAEFCQGRTKRWAIAWTFTNHPVKDFLPSAEVKSVKPITWIIKPKHDYEECINTVEKLLDVLRVRYDVVEHFQRRKLWKISATENTWTGIRRKRRQQLSKKNTDDAKPVNTPGTDAAYDAVNIHLKMISGATKRKLSEELVNESCKKIKFENTVSESCEKNRKLILGALLSVKRLGRVVQLQILYEYGERDCPQQILQYLKNNLV